jgi:hypothetical protein
VRVEAQSLITENVMCCLIRAIAHLMGGGDKYAGSGGMVILQGKHEETT